MASVLISTLVLDPGCEQDREDPYSNGVEEKINGTYVVRVLLFPAFMEKLGLLYLR